MRLSRTRLPLVCDGRGTAFFCIRGEREGEEYQVAVREQRINGGNKREREREKEKGDVCVQRDAWHSPLPLSASTFSSIPSLPTHIHTHIRTHTYTACPTLFASRRPLRHDSPSCLLSPSPFNFVQVVICALSARLCPSAARPPRTPPPPPPPPPQPSAAAPLSPLLGSARFRSPPR